MIPEEIKNILACPLCKGDLIGTESSFICLKCKLLYPIKEEIPIFLIEEAQKLSDEDIQKIKDPNYER
ncbi:Trm112 family protein [Persephonella sp.]